MLIVGSLLLRKDLRQLARGGEESSWSLAGAVRPLASGLRRLTVGCGPRTGAMVALVLGVAVLIPYVVHPYQDVLYSSLALYVFICLSLVVLTGWSGQVSLGQAAFVGVGALVGGRMEQLGYPLLGTVIFVMAAGVLGALSSDYRLSDCGASFWLSPPWRSASWSTAT